jgi:phosphatidylserine decarboxylase precursor
MGCFNSKAVAAGNAADPFAMPVQPLSPVAQQEAPQLKALQHQATDIVTDAETASGEALVAKTGKSFVVNLFIIQAKDLPGADRRLLRKRTSDPYSKAKILFDDGTESPWQQTKFVAANLNPTFNHTMSFVVPSGKVPKSFRLECLDYDALSAHDPLGNMTYAISQNDTQSHPKVRWYALKDTPSGSVQLQVSVEEVDPNSETGKIKLSTAERTGLLTLRMEAVSGLRPGPHAIKVIGEEAFKTGNYQLKAYVQYGLRSFNGKPVAGVAIPNASPKAATSAPPDTASEGLSVPIKQDLKIWQRQGEENYLVQVTLVAISTHDSKKAAVVGKGFLTASVLSDTAIHLFNVHLREEPPKQQDLTDAEQSAMLSAMGISPTAAAASPSAASPASPAASTPAVDAVDGSGFRESACANVHHTLSHGGVAGEDSPADGGAASPPVTVVSPTSSGAGGAGLATDSTGNITPTHESGLEAGAPGLVTACITLKGALESRAQLEQYFHLKLLENFDVDKSGSLDATEMVAMLHTLGCEVTTEQVDEIVKEFDTSGDGMLDAAELLQWFQSPAFHSLPYMSYSLLAFVADGKRGVDELINDVTRVVKTTDQTTKAGAGIVALTDADKEMLVDRGLKIFDRKTGLILTENIPSAVKTALNIMYHSAAGSKTVDSAAVRRLLHKLSVNEGKKMDLPSSKAKIKPFVDLHRINMQECLIENVEDYANFNEFFARSLKPTARPIDAPHDETIVVSAADCRAVVYENLAEATKIWIKGKSFTLEKLLGPDCQDVLPLFLGGSLAVFRLSPQDYHRWHLPVTGRLGRRHAINGALYTVNPIAVKRNAPSIYDENKREVCLIHTAPFGLVALIAVGATVVGSINIVQPDGTFQEKGACHGAFKFGGSTVIALFQPGCVQFDADLLNYSRAPLETYIRVGERVGKAVPGAKPLMGLAADDADYVAYQAKVASAAAAAGGAVAVAAETTVTAGAPPEAAAAVAHSEGATASSEAPAPAPSS